MPASGGGGGVEPKTWTRNIVTSVGVVGGVGVTVDVVGVVGVVVGVEPPLHAGIKPTRAKTRTADEVRTREERGGNRTAGSLDG